MNTPEHKPHRRLVTGILLTIVGMFGFGYALAPLYQVFCKATGFNGTTANAVAAPIPSKPDATRLVTMEFFANINTPEPWTFRPSVPKLEIQPGRTYTLSYTARNPTARAVTTQAMPSVAPGPAALHVHKIECFCFTRQHFKPHEQREMALRLTVDSDLPVEINTLSLAYSLFEVPPEGAE